LSEFSGENHYCLQDDKGNSEPGQGSAGSRA